MKSYSFVKMIVDGKETASLDIYSQHNIFNIFEYDINVFAGSYSEAIKFIEGWKAKKQQIRDFLEAAGHFVTYEQSI